MDFNKLVEKVQNKSVLIVDDDAELATAVYEILEMFFGSLQVANDGKKALEILLDKKFDLIITDIEMPQVDGFELTRKIKEMDKNQKVIISTAYNEDEYIKNIKASGADRYVHKPIDTEELLDLIFGIIPE